jgi:hypothetical protein
MSDWREYGKELGKGAASGAFNALLNGGNPLKGALDGLMGVTEARAEMERRKIRPIIAVLCIVRIVICAIIGYVTGMSISGLILFALGPFILFEIIVRTITRIADGDYVLDGVFVVAIVLHVVFTVVVLIFRYAALFRFLFWNLRLPF